jgi:NhaP-type Na+/H+ or K+/H+ antiporter
MTLALIISAVSSAAAALFIARMVWLWGYTQAEIDAEKRESKRLSEQMEHAINQRWN